MSFLASAYSFYALSFRSYQSFKLLRDGSAFSSKQRNWKLGASGLKDLHARHDQVKEALQFWVLYALLVVHELYFEVLVSWFPFYYYAKLALLWYIMTPGTKGAPALFEYLEPRLLAKVTWIDETVVPMVEEWTQNALSVAAKLSSQSLESLSDDALEDFAHQVEFCRRALDKERARRQAFKLVARALPWSSVIPGGENDSVIELVPSDEDDARSRDYVVVTPPLGGGFSPPPPPPRKSPPYAQVRNASFYPTRGIVPPPSSVASQAPPQPSFQDEEDDENAKLSDLLRSPPRARKAIEEIKSPAATQTPSSSEEGFFARRLSGWTVPRWPFASDAAPLPSPISPIPGTPVRAPPAPPPEVEMENIDAIVDNSPIGPITRSKARRRRL
jgi:hypothetical protein